MINNPIIRPYFLGVGMEMGGVALRFPLEHPTVLFVGPFCLFFFFKKKVNSTTVAVLGGGAEMGCWSVMIKAMVAPGTISHKKQYDLTSYVYVIRFVYYLIVYKYI